MKTELPTPKLTANDLSLEILGWHVKDGAYVNKGDDLVDFGTSKAAVTHTAETSGFVRQLKRPSEWVRTGEPFAAVFSDASAAATLEIPTTASHLAAPEPRLSRAAQAYAEEHGLKPSFAHESLVTVHDLKTARRDRRKQAEISNLQHANVDALLSSVTIQFTYPSEDRDILAQVVCACAALFAEYPLLRTWYEHGELHAHTTRDIGVALDVGAGLKVVTIPVAGEMTAEKVKERLAELALRDLRSELRPEDVGETCFTISDLSGVGVLFFEPLLNSRQSAILGIGGDRALPGSPISFTLRFDHRVLDGRHASGFLQKLKARVLGSVPCS